jgi:hypothetical protein
MRLKKLMTPMVPWGHSADPERALTGTVIAPDGAQYHADL